MAAFSATAQEPSMSDLIKFDGLDEAILGVASRIGSADFLVYSRGQCIGLLMESLGCNYMEAEEYFDFNVAGAYVGESTPAFLEEYEGEEE
jgi:hypothetical protein